MAPHFGLRKSTLIFSFLFSLLATSAPNPEQTSLTDHIKFLDQELASHEYKIKKSLQELSFNHHRATQGPQSAPGNLMINQGPAGRRQLGNLLAASIKMKIKQLEIIQRQRTYLKSDVTISQGIETVSEQQTSFASQEFGKCSFSPLKKEDEETTLEVERAFGDEMSVNINKFSSKAQGTWLKNTNGLLAQSCSQGEIILSEKVEGRGYVVAIRHGVIKGKVLVVVYGNLEEDSIKGLRVGMRVPAGAPLGISKEKFYFEVRKGSEAIDPREIILF